MTDFMTYVHDKHPEEEPLAAWERAILTGEDEPKGAWFINVYERGREYGGPEEGGWWFDTGGLVDTNRLVNVTETEAWDIARQLEDEWAAKSREDHIPPVHSVMYRGGWFSVRAEQQPGADWPAERPHYE